VVYSNLEGGYHGLVDNPTRGLPNTILECCYYTNLLGDMVHNGAIKKLQ